MNEDMSPEQAAQLEAAKKNVLSQILDKEAFERLGRVRIANPQLAAQIEIYLIQLHQSGQLNEKVTDKKLKQILDLLTEKKETSIKRR